DPARHSCPTRSPFQPSRTRPTAPAGTVTPSSFSFNSVRAATASSSFARRSRSAAGGTSVHSRGAIHNSTLVHWQVLWLTPTGKSCALLFLYQKSCVWAWPTSHSAGGGGGGGGIPGCVGSEAGKLV